MVEALSSRVSCVVWISFRRALGATSYLQWLCAARQTARLGQSTRDNRNTRLSISIRGCVRFRLSMTVARATCLLRQRRGCGPLRGRGQVRPAPKKKNDPASVNSAWGNGSRKEALRKTHDVSRTVVSHAKRDEDRVVQEAVVQAESVPLRRLLPSHRDRKDRVRLIRSGVGERFRDRDVLVWRRHVPCHDMSDVV